MGGAAPRRPPLCLWKGAVSAWAGQLSPGFPAKAEGGNEGLRPGLRDGASGPFAAPEGGGADGNGTGDSARGRPAGGAGGVGKSPVRAFNLPAGGFAGDRPAGSFDLAVCNPPYFPPSSGPPPKGEARRTARTEESCTLEEVCRAAARLLRWGGSFCLVHKPERLADLVCALRESGLEPKRLRFVCVRPERAPSLILMEARRGGRPGLRAEPPLALENADGSPTAELNRIYFREEAPL